MTTGHVFIATSLDGFIARRDGSLDWLIKQPTDGEDHGYDAFMASVDGLVMGRGSFETVLAFEAWPYEKPVIVMSRSLAEADIPASLRPKVRLSRATPRALMQELAAEGWQRAYIDGGKLIQSFLREGLIADITLTRVPVLIGQGRPLFGDLPQDIVLEHLSTRGFRSGLVTSKYRVT
jgi:dihydrofolate reductase